MNLIIRNVNLIDGTGAAPVPSTSVVVENGVISWIGEGDISSLNRSHYEEINGQDLTLMPGTLDCHEHFCGDGGKDGVRIMSQQADDRDVLFERAVNNARRALMAGQTSARDVGSPHGISITLARAVAAGSIPGPRITASGQWIQFPTTWAGASMRTVNSAQQMRDTINAQVAQGAGLIKVGATGENEDGTGYGTLGFEIAKLVADMAHAVGLKAAAHCWYARPADTPGVYDGARQAVEAGIDSIEHGTHIDEETAKLMAEKGTYHVPTQSTWDYPVRAAARWGMPKADLERYEHQRDSSIASVKRCMKYGVKIVAGTDAGGAPVRHGTLVREMELLVLSGMEPMDAIRAATSLAAELTGTLDQVGTVEVGKLADLVLVDGDPMYDIQALRNIWAVFQGGRRIR